MAAATGRLVTLVAYDADGVPHPLLIDADGNIKCVGLTPIIGGSLESPNGNLVSPVGSDPDGLPRNFLVDANGYLKIAGGGSRVKLFDELLDEERNFSFADIPQTYSNLEILLMARANRAALGEAVNMYINEDYNIAHYHYAIHTSGTIHTAYTGYDTWIGAVPGNTANIRRAGIVKGVIPSYKETVFNKNIRSWSGDERAPAAIYMYDFYNLWWATDAIEKLEITADFGTGFMVGSRLQIWGVL